MHDNKKPYVCDHMTCGMAFARKNDLRRHSATHTGANQKFCARCEHWFSRKDAYLDHVDRCNATPPRKQIKSQRDARPIQAAGQQRKHEAEMLMLSTLDFNGKHLHDQPINVPYPVLPSMDCHRSDKKQQVEMLDELFSLTVDTPRTGHGQFISFQAELNREPRDPVQLPNPMQRVFRSISTDGDLNVAKERARLSWISKPLSTADIDLNQTRVRTPTTEQTTSFYENIRLLIPFLKASRKRDLQLQCFLCDRKHLTVGELQDHFIQHQRDCSNPRRYACSECEVSFHHHFELEAHREAVQQIQIDSGQCNCCGEPFQKIGVSSHQAFGRHLRGNDSDLGVIGNCYRKRMAQDYELAILIRDQLGKVSHNPLVRVPSKRVRPGEYASVSHSRPLG